MQLLLQMNFFCVLFFLKVKFAKFFKANFLFVSLFPVGMSNLISVLQMESRGTPMVCKVWADSIMSVLLETFSCALECRHWGVLLGESQVDVLSSLCGQQTDPCWPHRTRCSQRISWKSFNPLINETIVGIEWEYRAIQLKSCTSQVILLA